MTDPNKALIAVVVDRSGSMSSCRTDMQGGFDAFIKAQRELPGECRVTLVQFDNFYEVVYVDKPIADVPPLVLSPRGSTALLDAIGRTVTEVGERLDKLPEDQRPGSVEVVIITDGEENASREWQPDTVRELLKRQQEVYSWRITFLGANIDAVATAADYGIPVASAMTFDTHHTVGTYTMASAASANFRGARSKGVAYGAAMAASAFDDSDRKKAMGKSEDDEDDQATSKPGMGKPVGTLP